MEQNLKTAVEQETIRAVHRLEIPTQIPPHAPVWIDGPTQEVKIGLATANPNVPSVVTSAIKYKFDVNEQDPDKEIKLTIKSEWSTTFGETIETWSDQYKSSNCTMTSIIARSMIETTDGEHVFCNTLPGCRNILRVFFAQSVFDRCFPENKPMVVTVEREVLATAWKFSPGSDEAPTAKRQRRLR